MGQLDRSGSAWGPAGRLRLCLALAALGALALLTAGSPFAAKADPLADTRRLLDATLIDRTALEAAQPALVAKALAAMPKQGGGPRTYVVTVAAGGSQDIFAREALAVRDLFGSRLGPRMPAVVLSNARGDLYRRPLASRANLAAVLQGIGKGFDNARDLLLFYITSHGSPDAFVQTDLPDGHWIEPIDAGFLAQALGRAGIARRVLIISACYSGTWIDPLKSRSTIVLTASTPYRPSFGCSNSRQYTFYGEAFIGGGIGKGLSWHESYLQLQDEIGRQEWLLHFPASGPMAEVGEDMAAVWDAPLGPSRTR